MGVRRRRALVRGKPSSLWFFADDNYVLPHPRGLDDTSVPAGHLVDEAEMERHYARLGDKRWVTPAALAELREIVAAVRR